MCGIAGIYKFDSTVSLPEIERFTDSLQHRGPDGSGYQLLEDNKLALGHRRLSILDLSEAGKQPMSYADGRYWISFNGEIYNFIELKKELISYRYSFRSDSDTEVILAAYDKWKENCFHKFNGMWAIAIWDSTKKQLILCRDRFGVKPLHYTFIPGKIFAFASETLAFKNLEGFERRFNQNNLIRALHAHNSLEASGETIFEHILQVLPGHLIKIQEDRIPQQIQWWKVSQQLPPVPKKFEDQKEEFKALFADACKIRLRSDVPVASALSGGLDSTSVYCMLPHVVKDKGSERISKDWQTAFSITFPGSHNDESEYIKTVLEQTGGKGIIIEPSFNNLVNELQTSTAMSDLISGTPLNCLTPVYREMHKHGIVVSMDGHGADEYLYGYQSSVAAALVHAYSQKNDEYAKQLEDTILKMSAAGSSEAVIESAKKRAASLLALQAGVIHQLKKSVKKILKQGPENFHFPSLHTQRFFNDGIIADKIIPGLFNATLSHDNLGEKHLLNEFHYTDLPYNLRDFDRGAMQHQVEIRMPFMDYRLVTYSMALPQQSKLNNGYTKYILRESLKGIIPENIRARRLKIGLSAPIADWFNGPLNEFLMDTCGSAKLQSSHFLNATEVKTEITRRCSSRSWESSNAQPIWPILNYLLLNEN